MKKFENITIISDMDGTLLTEEKTISKQNLEAIRYFRENGGTFTIATGRIFKKVLMYSEILQLDVPFISHNGGVIYDPVNKKIVDTHYLEGDYINVIEEIYKAHPYMGIEVYTDSDVRFIKKNKYIDKHIEDEKFLSHKNEIRWYNFRELTERITKILMANSKKNSDILEKKLPEQYPDYNFVRSEAHYFEILPPGISKGSASKKLIDIINKKADIIYAIGDNMNDYELLEFATIGVSVKNAAEKLKEVSDVVLDYTNEENAVARLIDMIENKIAK